MGYDRTALKRPINVSLNEDLVRQARRLTRNMSATIEDLLASYVEKERARRRADEAAHAELMDFFNAIHAEHGLLSEEFQPEFFEAAEGA